MCDVHLRVFITSPIQSHYRLQSDFPASVANILCTDMYCGSWKPLTACRGFCLSLLEVFLVRESSAK